MKPQEYDPTCIENGFFVEYFPSIGDCMCRNYAYYATAESLIDDLISGMEPNQSAPPSMPDTFKPAIKRWGTPAVMTSYYDVMVPDEWRKMLVKAWEDESE